MRKLMATAALVLTLGCQEQPPPEPPATAVVTTTAGDVQVVNLKVSGGVYQPAAIRVRAGVPLRLSVTRDEKPTCGDVLVIPSQNISTPIPVNKVTTIEFTPQKAGDLEFTCAMNMMRGRIVVQ